MRISFNHWVIIWTPSKPSCLKTLLLLIMAPVHCWSVTWLFSFCLGNDLAQIPWIVQNQLHGRGWLMMGEPKKVDSFQLSLPWTRAQSSGFAETYLPEEQFSLTSVYGTVWATKASGELWARKHRDGCGQGWSGDGISDSGIHTLPITGVALVCWFDFSTSQMNLVPFILNSRWGSEKGHSWLKKKMQPICSFKREKQQNRFCKGWIFSSGVSHTIYEWPWQGQPMAI